MYSLSGYGQMITDRVRMGAYQQALRQAIRPGDTVLDIGTGTGIMALMACQMGAGYVYAIEPADVIQLAREIAADNGFADRITFIQDISTRITLPKQADVMVCDIRGVLPLFESHIPAIADVRARLLAPGGILIPKCDELWVAPVSASEHYARLTEAWNTSGSQLNMDAAKRAVLNAWTKARLKPDQLLGAPQRWAALDYTCIQEPDINGTLNWTADQEGMLHGWCMWFDTVLLGDIGFSNAPDAPELIYGNAFFPLEQPTRITPGVQLSVEFRANLVGDDYLWQWNTQLREEGSHGQITVDSRQSTFFGAPLSPESLKKRAAGYTPSLNAEGKVLEFALNMMTTESSLAGIAQQLLEQFSGRFRDLNSALAYAGELAVKYG